LFELDVRLGIDVHLLVLLIKIFELRAEEFGSFIASSRLIAASLSTGTCDARSRTCESPG